MYKNQFWTYQPVFHIYDIMKWLNPPGLIREKLPEIYKYTNFSAHPVSYCGVYITDSPRYDPAKDGTNFQIGTISSKK